MSEDGASRRALLRGAGEFAASASAIALLGGCGGTAPTGSRAVKQAAQPTAHADLRILLAALNLERRTVAAYVATIPLLPTGERKGVRTLLSQELQHTGELLSLINAAGGTAPPHGDSYDIGRVPRSRREAYAQLHALERLQIASYLRWIPRLSPAPVRAAVSTILAADAQHVAVLRAEQGEPALAGPFVTGRE